MSILPHAYDEQENLPSYTGTSDISARWHVINTPAKALYGSRGISLVSNRAAITSPGITSSTNGYDLIFVDSLTIEVHPKAPLTGPESSKKSWETPSIAKIRFSPHDPSRADITFARDEKLIVESSQLRKGLFSTHDTNPSEVRLVNMYNATGQVLPIAWMVQDNEDVLVTSASEKPAVEESVPETDVFYSESKGKWSWKSISKDIKSKEHKKSRSMAEEEKAQIQRKGLSSNFELFDASANAYANFANEFFKDPSTTAKIPTYEKEVKHHKSWGHLDIRDPQLKAIRSSDSTFEKWSEAELELVVLLTLVVILEVNIKIYGGSSRDSVFSQAVFADGTGGVEEGEMGVVGSSLGAVKVGISWIEKSLGNAYIQ